MKYYCVETVITYMCSSKLINTTGWRHFHFIQATTKSTPRIPGQVTDRRTMLGELNWIFTAITDTIAWSSLPPELFQQLFRADLLTASLCRNFLLADRIMRYAVASRTPS